MADGTKIEWTDATVNAVNGCSVVSPGCTHCYAMRLAGTRLRHHSSRALLTMPTKAGPVWTGEVRLNERALLEPLRWKRPRRIFWNAHGDLFHEKVPDEWIDRCFAVMALTPQHQHQVLTKRAERMREYFADTVKLRQRWASDAEMALRIDRTALESFRRAGQIYEAGFPLPNVWLGVSVEDQARADERIPNLLATPAAVRFLSCEPLLGSVDVRWALARFWPEIAAGFLQRGHFSPGGETLRALDLIIAGGESGPKARPMHPDWARSLRDQCAAAGVPFFFKQWGEWESSLDRDRDDPDWRADYTNDYVDHGRSRWLNLAGGCGFHGERLHVMRRVGKAVAGRLLDGVDHNGMPA